MFKWRRVSEGQRASDRLHIAEPAPRRDRELEAIIAHERITVLFQPQIDPANGEIRGAEALARWEGADSAESLFARASGAGLSERLSRLVQRKALRRAAAWEGPLRHLRLSINILPEDINRNGYEDWLVEEIGSAGIDPRRVTVEITESALLTDTVAISAKLERLRALGVSVALDDFGTGYASLSYLAGLPLDALKIDRGLVQGIAGGERDRIVVRAMIQLARDLDLQVVVEGVESTGQLALLAGWGVDLYQGFIGAGALDEVELERFVAVSKAEAA